MTSDSSNTKRTSTPQGEKATKVSQDKLKPSARFVEVDGEATETFSFHVSAAEAADLKQKSRVDSQAELIAPKERLRSLQALSDSNHSAAEQRASSEQAPVIRIDRPIKQKQKIPSLVASLLLHAVLLLPFGFLTQAELPAVVDDSLLVRFAPSEPLDQLEIVEELEIEAFEEFETIDVELASDVPDPGVAGLTDLSAENAFEDLSAVISDVNSDEWSNQSESLGDLGSLAGDTSQGLSDHGENLGGVAKADFFGTKVTGNRIVYVLDNSGGMVSGELETLVAELLRSVKSLTPKQHFYVIFYSDSLYPLFYPNAPQHFVKATNENKRSLENWLDTVELCVGNVVDEAMAAATAIRPDVVYLLTDGDLDSTRDQRRIRFLLDSSGRTFPIHTFGLGTGKTSKAAGKLKQVAEANGGSFRAVEVNADAVALAKIKKRAYHNKSPGEVWGLRVGKR